MRLAVLAAFGCTPTAYTPPARPMPLSPAQIPERGKYDVQLDGNTSGSPLGPGIFGANLRYRHAVAEHVALVGDAGFARAHYAEDGGPDPDAGMGRAGAQWTAAVNEDVDAAVFGGVGAGYAPTAGGWASTDAGAIVSSNGRNVRLAAAIDAFFSQPFATRMFEVQSQMLRLPTTLGVMGLVGVEVGPRDRAIVGGLALAGLRAAATDAEPAHGDLFLGLGGGFRFGQ